METGVDGLAHRAGNAGAAKDGIIRGGVHARHGQTDNGYAALARAGDGRIKASGGIYGGQLLG